MRCSDIRLLTGILIIFVIGVIIPLKVSAQPAEIKLEIDGTTKYQTMDGFGVNINPTWWYNGEYMDVKVVQPAIDLLIDSLGATIFRVVIEEIDWEEVNDDNDPDNFNWTYYNRIFSSARFQGVWETLRYLNKRGILDGLVISFMGAPPASAPLAAPVAQKSWMGGTDHTIDISMEDELAESIAALLYYMRFTASIQFTFVSPMNETDIIAMTKSAEHPDGIVEGPNIPDAVQYVRVVRKLAEKLDAVGMGDIRFVAPDAGSERLFGDCLNEMVKDPYLMGKLEYWGVHQYGNDAGNYYNIIYRSAYPTRPFWVTETAGITNMLGQLDDNARAYIFWDGFDCVYQHGIRNGYGSVAPNDWVFWLDGEEGKPLIEYVAATGGWIPRKQFYEHAQLMKFVRPGSMRIGTKGEDSTLSVHAWLNPDGNVIISGRSNSDKTITVKGILANLPGQKSMKLTYTNSTTNLNERGEIKLSGESFTASIPAESVFTISGLTDGSSSISELKPEPPGW
jgi:O-glycosyl hydrolase